MSRYNIKLFLRMKSNEMVFPREKSIALVTRYNNSNAALVWKVSALTLEFRSKLFAIVLSAI